MAFQVILLQKVPGTVQNVKTFIRNALLLRPVLLLQIVFILMKVQNHIFPIMFPEDLI